MTCAEHRRRGRAGAHRRDSRNPVFHRAQRRPRARSTRTSSEAGSSWKRTVHRQARQRLGGPDPGGAPTPGKPEVTLIANERSNRVSSFLNLRVADIQACDRDWSAPGAEFLTEPLDRGADVRRYMRDPKGPAGLRLERPQPPPTSMIGSSGAHARRAAGRAACPVKNRVREARARGEVLRMALEVAAVVVDAHLPRPAAVLESGSGPDVLDRRRPRLVVALVCRGPSGSSTKCSVASPAGGSKPSGTNTPGCSQTRRSPPTSTPSSGSPAKRPGPKRR